MGREIFPAQGTISNQDVDTAEDVIVLPVADHTILWATFLVGTANLSALTVEFRFHPSGDWASIASAAADYTSPEGPVLGASGDLTTAAFGSTVHWLKLNVEGVHEVRIKAAGTSSTITGHWQLT